MAEGQSIKLLGLGLDDRFRAMLQVFFERRRSTQYQFVNREADILVADMDVFGVRDAFADYRRKHSSKPTIMFSLNESEYKTSTDIVVLHKPFTVKQLISAFDIMDLQFRVARQRLTNLSVKNQESAKTRVNKKQASPARKKKTKEAGNHFQAASLLSGKGSYTKLNSMLSQEIEQSLDMQWGNEYDPGVYLQGALLSAFQQALDKNKNILLEYGSGSITVDVRQQLVQMGMGGFQLRELASFPLNLDQVTISVLPRRQAKVDVKSGRTIISFDALLWKASLFASRGRVPLGTSLDTAVQLKCWPNFTRLLLSPGALRMAALWTEQAFSISQLSKTLNLSMSDVVNFYSAAHAIELIQERDTGQVVNPPERKAGVRGLLSSILKKLHT